MFLSISCLLLDPENPTLSGIPSDITQDTDSGLSTATVSWTEPTESDNSGQVTLTSSHSPGDSFSIGTTVVSYTATDSSSNTATDSFTITVEGTILNSV